MRAVRLRVGVLAGPRSGRVLVGIRLLVWRFSFVLAWVRKAKLGEGKGKRIGS